MTSKFKHNGILVFGEIEEGHLATWTAQLMRAGRKLADELNQELNLILLGTDLQAVGQTGFAFGADNVYTVSDPLLEHYLTDSYIQAMEQVVQHLNPYILLFGQNEKGMDLAPRLAFRLEVGIILDCVDVGLDCECGLVACVKPVFGGKAHCKYTSKGSDPLIISIRNGSFEAADCDQSRTGEIINFEISLVPSEFRTRFLKKIEDDGFALACSLLSAPVVVSGGRGLKKQEGFDLLRETAKIIGGIVAGSRPAIDSGWLPNALQVGLTGVKINPEIYFAIGISGAMQHMAGCLKSKVIVAINNDEAAPIFQMSHYGVIADYNEVLRAFNDEIVRAKSEGS